MTAKPTLFFLLVMGMALDAHATNWLQVQGNEPLHSDYFFKFFGFMQPTYTYIDADPISGLDGVAVSHNGKYIVPNLVGPDLDGTKVFQFNLARLGVRGNLVPNKIN